MDKPTHVIFVAVMTAAFIAAVVYIGNHQPRIDCWNFFGLTKGCTASVNPQ